MLSQKKADKSDMDETIEESRELRRKLIETQTNLAVVRSEMENLRSEYEVKCDQFNNKYVNCKRVFGYKFKIVINVYANIYGR